MSPLKSPYLFAALVGTLPAAALLLMSTVAEAASPRPSVIVFNQPVKNDTIDITYANLPRDGFLVVLGSDKRGMPSHYPVGVVDLKCSVR
jgi:hypothetical protein